MQVKELIEKLQGMPQDAKVYLALATGAQTSDKIEDCLVYDTDCEYKTVHHVRDVGGLVPYTGVFFQID